MSPRIGWLLCVTHLPGLKGAARVRHWRALRCAGAAVLRDGVYLLPERPVLRAFFDAQAKAVRASGGTAHVLKTSAETAEQEVEFRALFDRSAAYREFAQTLRALAAEGTALTRPQAVRRLARLQKEWSALEGCDFFPGEQQAETRQSLENLSASLDARLTPGEPTRSGGRIASLDRNEFLGRTWVTRAGLWVDRVASAWLIRQFIDPSARFQWLKDVSKRPRRSLGFDFDGAEFTHVGARVSFEVLLASFGLEDDAALRRLGTMVRTLDLGGASSPEAQNFIWVLRGARARCGEDDDRLLAEVSSVLDCLYAGFALTDDAGRTPTASRKHRRTR